MYLDFYDVNFYAINVEVAVLIIACSAVTCNHVGILHSLCLQDLPLCFGQTSYSWSYHCLQVNSEVSLAGGWYIADCYDSDVFYYYYYYYCN